MLKHEHLDIEDFLNGVCVGGVDSLLMTELLVFEHQQRGRGVVHGMWRPKVFIIIKVKIRIHRSVAVRHSAATTTQQEMLWLSLS